MNKRVEFKIGGIYYETQLDWVYEITNIGEIVSFRVLEKCGECCKRSEDTDRRMISAIHIDTVDDHPKLKKYKSPLWKVLNE